MFLLKLGTANPRTVYWRDLLQVSPRPSKPLAKWLTLDDSLTEALIKQSKGAFGVDVLFQGYRYPRRDEALTLRIPLSELCLIREVVLNGEGAPWVFARSLIPVSRLRHDLRRLTKQGAAPLGRFLFSHRNLRRTPFKIAAIDRRSGYVPAHLLGGRPAFGRRSIFTVNEQPILVSEVFLPAFESAIQIP